MADYATLAELVTGYLPSITSAADQTVLSSMITRASRAIDTRTRRPIDAFAPAPPTASAAVFYGENQAVLWLPEFVTGSVTLVTATSVEYLPAAYREFRRREISTGSLRVGLHTATTDGILTPRAMWAKGVPFTVTARWGFLTTPAEITEACLTLVRHWWRQQQGEVSGPIGDLEKGRGGDQSGFPRGVVELLAAYVLDDVAEDSEAGTIERGDLLNSDFDLRGGKGT